MTDIQSNHVGSQRDYFASTAARNETQEDKTTRRSIVRRRSSISHESDLTDVGAFRKLPPFDAFTKFAWICVIAQVAVGIGGAVSSKITGLGDVAGVMSGIFGLWFIQMAWVMSLPSECSTLPYHIGLCLLPFFKSVGLLLVPSPNGEKVDWPEFVERMLYLIFLWCLPMWMAGNTTAEVVRCMHGDVSRYQLRNNVSSNTIFGSRSSKEIPVDTEGISIRERTMACTVKYIMILPIVIYITFNSIGALIETKEYQEFGPDAVVLDTFEFRTGRQFYVDYMRMFYSNIFQGLVTVFTMITISAFSCSAMDLGEVMIFRFHTWEIVAIFSNVLFFVAGLFFGSAVFDPVAASELDFAYWSIWILPCFLMISLYCLTRTVLYDRNDLTKRRVESNENLEESEMPHSFSHFMGVKSWWSSFNAEKLSQSDFGSGQNLMILEKNEREDAHQVIVVVEHDEKQIRENSEQIRIPKIRDESIELMP